MTTYQGGCHCKAVRYEVEADLSTIISCNCSHCEAKGLLLAFVPESQFKLTKGEDELARYQFNRMVIDHLFCRTCGVQSFSHGKNTEGEGTVAINVRCLDDIDLTKLAISPFDGKKY